jgi:hypothetical protein
MLQIGGTSACFFSSAIIASPVNQSIPHFIYQIYCRKNLARPGFKADSLLLRLPLLLQAKNPDQYIRY